MVNYWTDNALRKEVDGYIGSSYGTVEYIFYTYRLTKRLHLYGPRVIDNYLLIPTIIKGIREFGLTPFPTPEQIEKAKQDWATGNLCTK